MAKTGGKSSHAKASNESPPDPKDIKELEADLAKAIDALREGLGKIRPGGRFNPDLLNNLKVTLQKGSTENVKLGDLAQVIPKGRMINVIVGEKEHLKPVSAAILRSDLSLNPQQDPQNPMQLNIQIPPPTTDSRKQASLAAAKAGESATGAIKMAAQTQQKKFRAMEKDRHVRPDDRRKGESMMDKAVKKANEEARNIVNSAKKALESS